jgi:hypothetical protein
MEKNRIRHVLAEIRKVLWEKWDPIGINGSLEASDEYNGYAGGVYALLQRGATDNEIADYLRGIETGNMGLGRSSGPAHLRAVVGALRAIDLEPPDAP